MRRRLRGLPWREPRNAGGRTADAAALASLMGARAAEKRKGCSDAAQRRYGLGITSVTSNRLGRASSSPVTLWYANRSRAMPGAAAV